MLSMTSGTVTRIEKDGFVIRGESGRELRVRTSLPGSEIRVAAGDRVQVTGGPGGEGEWLSSSAHRQLPDGRWFPLRINPSDREPVPTTAKKPMAPRQPLWSKFLGGLAQTGRTAAEPNRPLEPLPAREFNSALGFSVTVYDPANRHQIGMQTPAKQTLSIPAGLRWDVSPSGEAVDLLAVVQEVQTQQVPGLLLRRLDDAGAECLDELAHLRWLTLADAWVTDAGLAHLSRLSSLQSLWLWNAPVTGAGLASLSGLTQLQELQLERTRLTEPGMAGLGRLRQLRTLSLNNTPVTDAGLAQMETLVDLRELSIRDTALTDAALSHLGKLRSLETLDLAGTRITGAAPGLEKLTALKELSLDGTLFADAGLQRLNGALELRTLNLMKTKVTGDGLSHISGLAHLESLKLWGAPVTDAGLAAVQNLRALKQLQLSRTKIGDAGLTHLESLNQLIDLSLYGTAVTDLAVPSLARMTSLRKLDLENTSVTLAGLTRLKEALPGCEISWRPPEDPFERPFELGHPGHHGQGRPARGRVERLDGRGRGEGRHPACQISRWRDGAVSGSLPEIGIYS